MLWFYLFMFEGFIATVLNSIKCYKISKKLSYIKPYEQLMLSLGCSDLLMSILTIAYGCFMLSAAKKDESGGIQLKMLVATFALTTINLLAIGLDRYIAIRHPIKHRNMLTRNRMKVFIILLWIVLLSFIVVIPAVVAIVSNNTSWLNGYFTWIASDWVKDSGIAMAIYYCLIVIISLRRRAKLNRQSITIDARATKHEISLIWTCVLSVFIYILTAFPYALHLAYRSQSSVYLAMLLLSNLIANPVVFFSKIHCHQRNQITVT